MYVHSITLGVTNNCNLACSYCFEGKKNKLSISVDVAKKAIDWLFRDDVSGPYPKVAVTFFGGEPLLEIEVIKTIVTYTRRKAESSGKSVSFSVTTNGVLFTEEIAKYWKDNELGVLLSCDGIAKAHNMFRRTSSGEGSFQFVERNIDNILSAGEGKEVRMTVTPSTAPYLAEGVKYLNDRGFESIAVFHAEEIAWYEEDYLNCERGFYEIGELMIDVIEKGIPLSIGPIENRVKVLKNGNMDDLNDGTCGAGKGYLAVGVDGTIYPCHRFASFRGFRGAYPIGDIFNGLDEKRRMPFLRMKKKLLLGCDVGCDQCTLYGKCSGGCLAANYQATGHLAQRPPCARFHEVIWYEVAKSIIDYFEENECPAFTERFVDSKEKPEQNDSKVLSADYRVAG